MSERVLSQSETTPSCAQRGSARAASSLRPSLAKGEKGHISRCITLRVLPMTAPTTLTK